MTNIDLYLNGLVDKWNTVHRFTLGFLILAIIIFVIALLSMSAHEKSSHHHYSMKEIIHSKLGDFMVGSLVFIVLSLVFFMPQASKNEQYDMRISSQVKQEESVYRTKHPDEKEKLPTNITNQGKSAISPKFYNYL